ncbi:MAG: gliding motility-associated C-terminal domain-containing protein [Sphingobacteriales bacterium JAD_PAG50586_3]|nr:MAG: gliding motility-associated C-terminal domain-containing protein [Sphingobacteriales bacterium JAD_PAG50586_3]
MRKLVYLLLFIPCIAFSQSLVVNFDFEDYSNCPSFYSNLGDVNSCTSPTGSTPDYFNTCATQGNYVDAPNNIFGYQQPHSGSGYTGIWSRMDPASFYLYREYIQMQFSSPLVVGTQYCVQFYASPADLTSMACNGLGILLRTAPMNSSTIENIPATPQLLETDIIDDTSAWTTIGGLFVADSAYTHIIIGNFYGDGQSQYAWTASPPNQSQEGYGAYYYIDDVIVTECPDSILPPTILPIVIPNVFTPSKADGFNDTFVIENLVPNSQLVIYNRWGIKVYESKDYKNDWDGDGHSDGVYYYILNTPDGKDYHGTLTIL